MTYSQAALRYISGPCSVGPVRAWTASDVAAAFDAGAASVAQPAERGEPLHDNVSVEGWRWAAELYASPLDRAVAAEAYDLLVGSPLAPVTAAPEPVLLTDPEDPRIRVGALVERTHAFANGEFTTYRHRIDAASAAWGVSAVRNSCRHTPTLLIEEAAPDPDADVLTAMEQTYADAADVALASLRAAGFDVVRVTA